MGTNSVGPRQLARGRAPLLVTQAGDALIEVEALFERRDWDLGNQRAGGVEGRRILLGACPLEGCDPVLDRAKCARPKSLKANFEEPRVSKWFGAIEGCALDVDVFRSAREELLARRLDIAVGRGLTR